MPKKANTRAANLMGTLRKRKDGRWEGRYTAPDGRQHSVYGKTQKAAAEALRAATHEVDTGTWLQPSTMSMIEKPMMVSPDHPSSESEVVSAARTIR